ncbi:hypothetical protein DRP07_00070 [Archaeoglobales archaeon]|nr:MAG: hypothetical protein DRP07_00070 [Archaeoglobales archaeon]
MVSTQGGKMKIGKIGWVLVGLMVLVGIVIAASSVVHIDDTITYDDSPVLDLANKEITVNKLTSPQVTWNFSAGDAPTSAATVIVSKEGSYTVARWYNGTVLYKSNDGYDDDDIQVAINAVGALGGGKVKLGQGIFEVDNSILINKSAITLEGEGTDATTLKLSNSANCDIIRVGNPSENVFFARVEKLTIDGNRVNQSATNLAGIRFIKSCSDYVLKELYIKSVSGSGVVLEYGWYGRFTRLWLEGNLDAGLKTNGTSSSAVTELTVTDSTMSINDYGLYLEGKLNGGNFVNLIIKNNEKDGVFITQNYPNTDTPRSLYFLNCRILDNSHSSPNTYNAITLDTFETGYLRLVFTSCEIYNSGDSSYAQKYLFEAKQWSATKGIVFVNNHLALNGVGTDYFNERGSTLSIYRNIGYHYTSQFDFPTSAPSSPQTGDAYFDVATNTLYVYNGTAWVSTTLS